LIHDCEEFIFGTDNETPVIQYILPVQAGSQKRFCYYPYVFTLITNMIIHLMKAHLSHIQNTEIYAGQTATKFTQNIYPMQ